MTNKYLGEKPLELENSPLKDWTREKIAMSFIESYGGIDGAHHKAWVLDQVARALKEHPLLIYALLRGRKPLMNFVGS